MGWESRRTWDVPIYASSKCGVSAVSGATERYWFVAGIATTDCAMCGCDLLVAGASTARCPLGNSTAKEPFTGTRKEEVCSLLDVLDRTVNLNCRF